jgi:hypothetical protein
MNTGDVEPADDSSEYRRACDDSDVSEFERFTDSVLQAMPATSAQDFDPLDDDEILRMINSIPQELIQQTRDAVRAEEEREEAVCRERTRQYYEQFAKNMVELRARPLTAEKRARSDAIEKRKAELERQHAFASAREAELRERNRARRAEQASQFRRRSKTFVARGDGTCMICDRRYSEGDHIAFVKRVGGDARFDVEGKMKAHDACVLEPMRTTTDERRAGGRREADGPGRSVPGGDEPPLVSEGRRVRWLPAKEARLYRVRARELLDKTALTRHERDLLAYIRREYAEAEGHALDELTPADLKVIAAIDVKLSQSSADA